MPSRAPRSRDTSTSFDCQVFLLRDSVVVNELGNASHSIATHLGFRPVGVVHPHASVTTLGRADQYKAITANAEMTIAHGDGEPGNVSQFDVLETIDVDVIVARTVHLRKTHWIPHDYKLNRIAVRTRTMTWLPGISSPSINIVRLRFRDAQQRNDRELLKTCLSSFATL